MTTLLAFHHTDDGDKWARAWQGDDTRHEMFDKIGVKCRTFRDPKDPDTGAVLLDISDMQAFDQFMASDEGQRAMAEDGLKVETLRLMTEFGK